MENPGQGGGLLRFKGFELDSARASLRGPDDNAIKIRPKTFDMLALLATNAGRVLSKQTLMETLWPNVHVGEDSLFQCIRELRVALGDQRRELVKTVAGRGYVFDAEVSVEQDAVADELRALLPIEADGGGPDIPAASGLAPPPRQFGWRRPVALAGLAFGAVGALAIVASIFTPNFFAARTPLVIAVTPLSGADNPETAEIAANVTTRLIDGLAKIDNIRVVAPDGNSPLASADFVVSGELAKTGQSWELRARMTRSATREVVWSAPVTVGFDDLDDDMAASLRPSRLAAGLGHLLALRLNEFVHFPTRPSAATGTSAPASTKAAIDQAIASINRTTRERFSAAQTILEEALTTDPDNIDLEVALASLQLRGIAMVWYSPADSAAAEEKAMATLRRALRARPDYIPVLEAYCRFLATTNRFTESLVACARTLAFDPWNGLALFQLGMTQIQLGRFEDGLASFMLAERFDTPQVSRWTWRLGAGLTHLLMGQNEAALPWLQRSLAVTPASGRTHILLAGAYQQLGRLDEAKAAMTKALELRPGSTADNVPLSKKNASPLYLAAAGRLTQAEVAAGLPER
jgi:DNA-binding winged helix-turn-helix (wHTH) protein/Tfp pilus assembly protein PilF/TolB-like protein